MKLAAKGGRVTLVCASLLLVGSLLLIGATLCEKVKEDATFGAMAGGLLGQPKDVKNVENSVAIDEIAKFAVQEHNTKEGKNLTFKKVVTAKEQVVAGTLYHLTLEAEHAGAAKLYTAKVWEKKWESHKSLESFQEAESSSSVSSDTHEKSGLRSISVADPVIKEAAEHALKSLNGKSNSLVSYELKDVLSAQAEAGDEETVFELLIKVVKAGKEDDLKSGLHRTAEGKWTVKYSNLE